MTHIIRVLLAVLLSGSIGWASLAIYYVIKVMQGIERFEAMSPDSDLGLLPNVFAEAINNMQGGSAVFLAAGIAGILLSEIFKTRSLLFYSGATGALTAVLATALWQQIHAPGNAQAAAALAAAGFVAGAVYWVVAGHTGSARNINVKKSEPKFPAKGNETRL